MKSILTIAIFILGGLNLKAQKQLTRTEIDTIEAYASKTLVEYTVFSDSNLIEKTKAFFYPTVLQRPRFRFLPNAFKTELLVDSIVFHGERIEFKDNGFYHSEIYENGLLLKSEFYDSTGREINESEFKGNDLTIGPCGITTGHYFYHGKKKKTDANNR
jgi:hypothetical protein